MIDVKSYRLVQELFSYYYVVFTLEFLLIFNLLLLWAQ